MPIIYLAALKKGAIRHAHTYYAIYRKLPTPHHELTQLWLIAMLPSLIARRWVSPQTKRQLPPQSVSDGRYLPSKHVYMGPIWAESGHLSHSGPAWAPYRLFCPYKTYIGPILVNFDQQTRIYGNHLGRFGAFIPFGSYLGPI